MQVLCNRAQAIKRPSRDCPWRVEAWSEWSIHFLVGTSTKLRIKSTYRLIWFSKAPPKPKEYPGVVDDSAMSDQNSSPNGRRRESVNSTSSDNLRYPFNHGSSHQKDANFKLSGKAWGRVKKFLLCKNAFPSSIYYIVGNEFCERFSYYGMKAILILYLTRVLAFGDNTATAVFHSFSMLCYFTPLFGAMMADGWLGKYRWATTSTPKVPFPL